MPIHRFHCGSPPQPGGRVELDEAESRHATRVLRLGAGDAVELFDGAGVVASARMVSAGRTVVVEVLEVRTISPPRPALTIASALPKGPRADAMIEQLSQLGADRFVPLRTQRSVVDPRDAKLAKYRRAAVESAKQCGRAHVMRVDAARDLAAVLSEAQGGCVLIGAIADEAMEERPGDIEHRIRSAAAVTVVIGPEGGWTDDELADAVSRGAAPWGLGPNVMRIETAAAAAAAIVRYVAASGEHA